MIGGLDTLARLDKTDWIQIAKVFALSAVIGFALMKLLPALYWGWSVILILGALQLLWTALTWPIEKLLLGQANREDASPDFDPASDENPRRFQKQFLLVSAWILAMCGSATAYWSLSDLEKGFL